MPKPPKPPSFLQLVRAMKNTEALQRSEIPGKARTKIQTKAAPNSFDVSLRGVPGAHKVSGFLRQIHDEETGTRVATPEQEVKLQRSAQNADTTKTLLTHSYLTGVNRGTNIRITPKTLLDRKW